MSPAVPPNADGSDAEWTLNGRDTLLLKTTGKWVNSTQYIITVEKGKKVVESRRGEGKNGGEDGRRKRQEQVQCATGKTQLFMFIFNTFSFFFFVVTGVRALLDPLEAEHSYSFYTPGVAIKTILPAAGM